MSKYDCRNPAINPNVRYNVYARIRDRLIKSDCTLVAIIPAGLPLSDSQVREFFRVDESHKDWDLHHRAHSHERFVFDKCIIPNAPVMYRIEVASDED